MTGKQWNSRIPKTLWDSATMVAAEAGLTKEDVTRAAFAAMFGTSDKILRAKLATARSAAKKLKLSFNVPSPPDRHGLGMRYYGIAGAITSVSRKSKTPAIGS